MSLIRYFIKDGRTRLDPQFASIEEINMMLLDAEETAEKLIKKDESADHAVYAVKRYEDGVLSVVYFYAPPMLLNDDEFYKRTEIFEENHQDCLIYAVHNHKSKTKKLTSEETMARVIQIRGHQFYTRNEAEKSVRDLINAAPDNFYVRNLAISRDANEMFWIPWFDFGFNESHSHTREFIRE